MQDVMCVVLLDRTCRYATSIADPKRRTFAGMLSCVDEGIGNVTAALATKGMLDNTVIVFTADNGGECGR